MRKEVKSVKTRNQTLSVLQKKAAEQMLPNLKIIKFAKEKFELLLSKRLKVFRLLQIRHDVFRLGKAELFPNNVFLKFKQNRIFEMTFISGNYQFGHRMRPASPREMKSDNPDHILLGAVDPPEYEENDSCRKFFAGCPKQHSDSLPSTSTPSCRRLTRVQKVFNQFLGFHVTNCLNWSRFPKLTFI